MRKRNIEDILWTNILIPVSMHVYLLLMYTIVSKIFKTPASVYEQVIVYNHSSIMAILLFFFEFQFSPFA